MTSHRANHPRWITLALVVTSIVAAVVLIGVALEAVSMIRAGQGQETFLSGWLVEYDWNGTAVFLGGALIAITSAAIYRWLSARRERRDLERLSGEGERGR